MAVTPEQFSSLYKAVEAKDLNTIKTTLESMDSDEDRRELVTGFQEISGQSIINIAASNNTQVLPTIIECFKDEDIRQQVLFSRDGSQHTPLSMAAQCANIQGIVAIISACSPQLKCDLLLSRYNHHCSCETEADQMTPLHIAAHRGNHESIKAILSNCPEELKPAVLSAIDEDSKTPFDLLTDRYAKYPSEKDEALLNSLNPANLREEQRPVPPVGNQEPVPPVGNRGNKKPLSTGSKIAIGFACFAAGCALLYAIKPDFVKSVIDNAQKVCNKYISNSTQEIATTATKSL